MGPGCRREGVGVRVDPGCGRAGESDRVISISLDSTSDPSDRHVGSVGIARIATGKGSRTVTCVRIVFVLICALPDSGGAGVRVCGGLMGSTYIHTYMHTYIHTYIHEHINT